MPVNSNGQYVAPTFVNNNAPALDANEMNGMAGAAAGAVEYDRAQALSAAQKAVARGNIDAGSSQDVAALQTAVGQLSSQFLFKGECTYAELPTTGNRVNDTWYVTDRDYNMTWNGTEWKQSSAPVQIDTTLSEEGQAAEAKVTGVAISSVNQRIDMVEDTLGLPAEYQPLSSLSSTADGNQYISIGNGLNEHSRVRFMWKYNHINTGNNNPVFGRIRSTTALYSFGLNEYNGILYARYGSGAAGSGIVIGEADTKVHVGEMSAEGFTLDGTKVAEFEETTFSSSAESYIFAMRHYTTSIGAYYGDVTIYGFEIYTDDVLTKRLIPCKRRSDGAFGMYDTVGSAFLTNASETALVAGDVVDVVGNGQDITYLMTASARADALAPRVATNEANIATNAVAITALETGKAEKSALAHTDRVVSALVEASKGKLLRFETDDDDGYAKTVPSGALNATVTEWGGKSVVWNQLIDIKKTGGSDKGVTVTYNGDGSFTVNGTATGGNASITVSMSTITTDATHKYHFFGSPSGFGGTTFYMLINGTETNMNCNNGIFTGYSETNRFITIRVYNGATVNNLVFRPRLVDLTQFGASDITSVSDPRIAAIEAYAAEHPEYNGGEIVSADVVSVNTQGANLFCVERYKGQTITNSGLTISFDNSGSSIVVNGTAEQNVRIPIFGDGTLDGSRFPYDSGVYTFTRSIDTSFNVYVYVDNGDNPTATGGSAVGTTQCDKGNAYCYIRIGNGSTFSNKRIDFGLFRGETGLPYVPYVAPTNVPIPSAVLTQYPLRSAGAVYDTIEYDGEKWWHSKRVGVFDCDAATWSGGAVGVAAPLTGGVLNNAVAFQQTSNYQSVSFNYLSGTVGAIALRDTNYIYYNGDSAPTGIVQFELATPVVTDITDIMGDAGNDLIAMAVEAGGTVTFAQNGGTIFQIPNTIEYTVKITEVE